jgi:hypothetical protein
LWPHLLTELLHKPAVRCNKIIGRSATLDTL